MPKQSRSWLFIAVVLLLVLVLVLVLGWLAQLVNQPREFSLSVINQSGVNVDQVRLFGTALEHDAVLLNLQSGQAVELETTILASGTLRVEISQGLNRIDSHIVEDTRILEALSQQLTIEPGNRFLLSAKDE